MAFRKPKNSQPKTLFGAELQRLMDENNMTLRDLSEKVGGTYEYARLLSRGQNLPSPYYIRAAAAALGVDSAHLESLVKQDKFNRDFGDMVPRESMAQVDSDLAPFLRAWPRLDQNQKSALLQMLRAFTASAVMAASAAESRR